MFEISMLKYYRYGYLDKVLSVKEGKTRITYGYHVDGQLATVTKGRVTENFIWDGLALVKRGTTSYVNEPHPGGGAPVASSNGGVMFNDILGTTLGVENAGGYASSSMTAFGDTANCQQPTSNFFTGKPHVNGLGHAFLLRNYRADLGKWPTADPLGYPDGWNQMTYCGNNSINCYDYLGAKVGDVYPTLDDAAEAWADEFLDPSIRDDKEYASYFYKNGDGYSYNEPNVGDEHSVKIPYPSDPSDYEGYIHSHGAESPTYDDDNFSNADRGLINTHGKSGYLVTPKGGLKRLDPFKKDPIIVNNNIRE